MLGFHPGAERTDKDVEARRIFIWKEVVDSATG